MKIIKVIIKSLLIGVSIGYILGTFAGIAVYDFIVYDKNKDVEEVKIPKANPVQEQYIDHPFRKPYKS